MKINRIIPIISTEKLEESRDFYTKNLGFQVLFENEWYILLESQDKTLQIAFVMPNHETQPPIFKPRFEGKGVFYTIEVDDVDKEYALMQKMNVKIEIGVRDEPWGERHFAVQDPNGVVINMSQEIPLLESMHSD